MVTKEKLRTKILDKIKKLSDEKLLNLDSYLNDLESEFSTNKSPLSFSGVFEGLELNELTSELHEARRNNNTRIPQF